MSNRVDLRRWLEAAKLSDNVGQAAMLQPEWEAFDQVFPEHYAAIPGMYDHTLCILFCCEMARTGDLP